MKKLIAVVLGLVLMLTTLVGCTNTKQNGRQINTNSIGSDIVGYYGCPNSNRVKKLKLFKRRIK